MALMTKEMSDGGFNIACYGINSRIKLVDAQRTEGVGMEIYSIDI